MARPERGFTTDTSKSTTSREGFIILPMDSMIGVRREFLDSTEMVLFNSDIFRVLSVAGVIRYVSNAIDRIVDSLKGGFKPTLPRTVLTPDEAVKAVGFSNPYARGKTYAALKIAEAVAGVTSEACFKEEDPERYTLLAAWGHEMMRNAALLCDEAREIEKQNDSILRTPHTPKGPTRRKTVLESKPKWLATAKVLMRVHPHFLQAASFVPLPSWTST